MGNRAAQTAIKVSLDTVRITSYNVCYTKLLRYKPGHYAPILDWSSADVWEFLLTESCPWGDHSELVEVYRYSSDECVYGEKQGVCIGNARYVITSYSIHYTKLYEVG